MRRSTFIAGIILVLAVAAGLRVVWLKSDPPTVSRGWVGIVWHDEGPWVHNARNRALWGSWRTDNWNPVFVTPVFTALEYGAFRTFGVGTWQARTVPVASGLIAIAFLIAGLRAVSGPRAALIGGALLATNYVFVMWNRAALMESTMTALIVISWSAFSLSAKRPAWAAVAGAAAVLAWFTKASAAFFLAAIVIELVMGRLGPPPDRSQAVVRAGVSRPMTFAIVGLVLSAVAIGLAFVAPHWSEYRFYNWQMSVVRKPDYSIRAFMDRASWLPIVNDFFMWMWPVFAVASVALLGVVSRWWRAKPAERLLVLWVIVGLAELVVHDSGNERRYVMFIPALIALAALALANRSFDVSPTAAHSDRVRWLSLPLVLGLGFLVAGSATRILYLDEIHAHQLHSVVVWSAAIAAVWAVTTAWRWTDLVGRLARARISTILALAIAGSTIAMDAVHFCRWALQRRELNYTASLQIGRLLPDGTLVQGKLANGLSLENRIRPVFIGHGFGNYDDRLQRDDVRYILTYVSPEVGFESQAGSGMIQELLDRYPRGRAVAILVVNETGPSDRAELFDKAPGSDSRARD